MDEAESGVRIIGEPVEYADGSEERVLDVIRRSADRRTASDDLASGIVDWPSTYHLSRMRANLLRPLTFEPGMRVLDAGAGTGALTRYVADTGARVVALEGTLARARAAAARCQGMDNVEVLCGAIDDYRDDDGHDVVLCVGVLEYAGAGGAGLLARLRELTRTDGALVLAIENQLGLRYLLGYEEDHLAQPWVGVEGYPGGPPVRTFSRRALAAMLREAGFEAQRWLFPFPDYKLPAAILDERAYERPGATTFVDQVVRWPSTDEASASSRVCDDRAAHRVFLEAGLGPDVANSLLVVAGTDDSAVGRVAPSDADAWIFSRERRRAWSRSKVFRLDPPPTVESFPLGTDGGGGPGGWLTQTIEGRQTFAEGVTVEALVLAALPAGLDAVGRALMPWREHLRSLETKAADEPADATLHPFRSPGAEWLLPPDHLDVGPANFVVGAGGALTFVDDEWTATGPVDAAVVQTRALWWFAADLVRHGVAHAWPPATTVDELAVALGALCDLPIDVADLDSWRLAEAQLQGTVSGAPEERTTAMLVGIGESSHLSDGNVAGLPFTLLRRQVSLLSTALSASEQARTEQQVVTGALQREVSGLRGHIGVLETALAAERETHGAVVAELAEARARREAFEGRRIVKLYRRLQRLAGG